MSYVIILFSSTQSYKYTSKNLSFSDLAEVLLNQSESQKCSDVYNTVNICINSFVIDAADVYALTLQYISIKMWFNNH